MRSTRAWKLSPWLIRILLPVRVSGSYLLGAPRPTGNGFEVTYVGRSDKDLRRRLLEHCAAGKASLFKFQPHKNATEAFLSECYLWHATREDGRNENIIHPAPPTAGRISCPYCS